MHHLRTLVLRPVGFFGSLRRGQDTFRSQDVTYGGVTDVITKVSQCALDSTVTPVGIVLGELNNEFADDFHLLLSESINSSPSGIFECDQFAVPCENGLRSDQRSILLKLPPSEFLAFNCQIAALLIIEPWLFIGFGQIAL